MKIAVSYWMLAGGLEAKLPVVEALRQAKKMGFDALELAIAMEGVLTHQTSQEECHVIRENARKIGIEISSVASGQSWSTSPSANDPAVRKSIIDFTKKALQITHWLGTDAYLFVPGAVDVFFNPASEVIPYDTCYKRACQAVAKLIPTAQKHKVTLCIENVWNKFLLSPLEMREFIDQFASPWVGAYFDAGNILQFGYPEHWIKILGKRIKRVHVKDFSTNVGNIDGFCDLGDGDVNFALVKRTLKSIGYNSYITAEVLPWKDGRLEKTVSFMQSILK